MNRDRRRRFTTTMKLFILLVLATAAAFAGQLTVTVPFDGTALETVRFAGYTSLSSPETRPLAIVGAPDLPVLPVLVALPAESRAVSVTVTEAHYTTLAGRHNIIPAAEQIPLSLMDAASIPMLQPNPEIYGSSETFPGAFARLESSEAVLGYPVASVSVYPVRWNPASGTLEVLESLTMEVEYVSDPTVRRASIRSQQTEQRTGDLVRGMVITPSRLTAAEPPLLKAATFPSANM
jgi:hypothetical protein